MILKTWSPGRIHPKFWTLILQWCRLCSTKVDHFLDPVQGFGKVCARAVMLTFMVSPEVQGPST